MNEIKVAIRVTKLELEIIKTQKQFILLKGNRGCGKTDSGALWVFAQAISTSSNSWVIAPDIKYLEFILKRIKTLCSYVDDISIFVYKKHYLELTLKPSNSKIYFITPRDLFDVFPKGRKPADFIFIDDAEYYTCEEQRKIQKKLQIENVSHHGNPRVLIAYTSYNQKDRIEALWKVIKSKDNWEHIIGFYEEMK